MWPTFQGYSAAALVVALIYALAKMIPALRTITVHSDTSLRTDLLQRIAKLETDLQDERIKCQLEINKLWETIMKLMQLDKTDMDRK